MAGVTMPDVSTQERLLAAYWQWVHPLMPILYRTRFTEQVRRSLHDPTHPSASQVPAFLLNAIFSLASRYCEGDTPMVFGRHW